MKIFFYVLLIVSIHQSKTIIQTRTLTSDVTIAPDFGKVQSKAPDDITTIGEIKVYIRRQVESFSLTLKVKDRDENKVIAVHTIHPCDAKSRKKFFTFMDQALEDRKVIEKSFLWSCPWKPGSQSIAANPRVTRFPFFVPSFLSRPGNYEWIEIYRIKQEGKFKTLLSLRNTFVIEDV